MRRGLREAPRPEPLDLGEVMDGDGWGLTVRPRPTAFSSVDINLNNKTQFDVPNPKRLPPNVVPRVREQKKLKAVHPRIMRRIACSSQPYQLAVVWFIGCFSHQHVALAPSTTSYLYLKAQYIMS